MPIGVCVHCSRHVSTDVHLTTTNFMEEVEGVGLGAAVTLFPVPVTALHFPSELLKEGVS